MGEPAALFQEHYLLPSTVEGAIWPFSREYPKPRHFHAQLEFLVILRGHARVRVGRSEYTVHADQLVWHMPGVEHALSETSSDCDLRVVHVEPDVCAEVARSLSEPTTGSNHCGSFGTWARELGALTSGRPVVELSARDRDRLLEQCDATCANGALDAGETSLRIRRALRIAWAATRAHHDDRRPLSLVELACCRLFDDPMLDRSAVCHGLDVSEGYLSRSFRRELGISFLEQRARLRVARFVTHVTREQQNCLDAALSAGFGSYSQLHRVFSQLLKMNPKTYFSTAVRNQRANQLSIG